MRNSSSENIRRDENNSDTLVSALEAVIKLAAQVPGHSSDTEPLVTLSTAVTELQEYGDLTEATHSAIERIYNDLPQDHLVSTRRQGPNPGEAIARVFALAAPDNLRHHLSLMATAVGSLFSLPPFVSDFIEKIAVPTAGLEYFQNVRATGQFARLNF